MIFLYLLLTFLLIGILVVFHEGGHFLTARASGIKVNEFSVGMGPAILSRESKKSGVRYSLRALPIGGYVAMEGEDGDSDNPDAFCNKSIPRRLLTVAAGPVTNFLLGFLCMLIIVCLTTPVSTVVASFIEGATSPEYGLCENDRIVAVNGTPVHTGNELVYEIIMKGDRPVDLTVVRDGEKIVVSGVVFPTDEEKGVQFGEYDFVLYAERKTPGVLIKHSFFRSVSTVKMVFDSIAQMITGRFGLEAVSGPVGMSEAVGEAVSAGFMTLFYLFAVISVNLGVMNLLPLPALDGGRILLLLISAVIRRPINKKVEQYITGGSMIILLAFMAFITVKDIIHLF